MTLDTNHFKEILEKEALALESQLGSIGKRSKENPDNWEVTAVKSDRDRADETEVADDLETLESNNAVINQLEIKLKEVNSALLKIKNGIYGVCEIGGEQIEEDRLEANPSASTCKAHMNN